jgi:putative membrane protein
MKRGAIYMMVACLMTFFACQQKDKYGNNESGTKDDSKEIAEDQNDEKFDNKAEKDADFAVKAAEASMLETRLAQLAESNASSSEVKSFARGIIADHNKTNEELKRLATQKNITLPASLSDKSQRRYDEIAGKSGREFDESFSDYMVKDHKDCVKNFKDEAEDGNDPELKAFAARTVPTLEHHLAMAEDLEKMVDKANRASNDK